ncbi:MAG: phosphate acyltransferase PlsX [Candidatus Coatesbacteria bacterium]|nr:phosphate acyltransferase PlsX [Candidatus Coatesbacteria bacterium]
MPKGPIALDAMGGDFAPLETVKGAVRAASDFGIEVVLVGEGQQIKDQLHQLGGKEGGRISICHAPEVVSMSDAPSVVIRGKSHSSIRVASNLVKRGEAAGVVSAGNTGAAMAAARCEFGLAKGVQRPAIAQVFPNRKHGTVVLDLGANVDCKIDYLVQFGVMGSVYASVVLNLATPKVGLLSIGSEDTKGNEFTRQVLAAMKETPAIDFVGNIEGRDVFKGDVDVVVCDGFVGNIVLKITEGVAETVMGMLKDAFSSGVLSKTGAALVRPSLKRLKKQMDSAEYGGAILLGVNGVCVICHGGSNAKAIRNALKRAYEFAESGIVEQITEKMQKRSLSESVSL